MSTELDDEILQRFYDGDLSPVEEHAVRARIAEDTGAQRRLQALERLSALMHVATEEAAVGLDSDAMFAQIERQIAQDQSSGFGGRLRVITSEWVSSKRQVLLPFAAAAAAAAVVALMFFTQDSQDDTARSGHKREAVRVAENAPTVHGSRVEQVDFGQSTGTVFEIESRGIATAVVWIADEEEEGL